MPSFRSAQVTEVISDRPGLQRVRLGEERAYVLTQLTGPVAVGDPVVINTTAVDLGLGTGGWHVVHWNLARAEWSQPGPGHIMKLRYTSLQVDTGAGEEQHPDIPQEIPGVPVVVASLHSQVPGIAVGIREHRPDARISYVMTDGAALPIAFSDLVASMVACDLIDATVTAGQAFGGDLEAVTVASALTLARHVQLADVIIVAMGPGVVGTGTKLGTTAIEVATILDLVERLGGMAILCPRISDADRRERHLGLSHHTGTALSLTHGQPFVVLPFADGAEAPDPVLVRSLYEQTAPTAGFSLTGAEAPPMALRFDALGLAVTTMGRGPHEEPRFFAACGAAGVFAVGRLPAGS